MSVDETGPEAGVEEGDAASAHDAATAIPWRELAATGRYREAFAASITAGFDEECERASSADLLVLADAALFSHRSDRALQALMSVRKRFPGSSAAAVAAFKLGVIAFDHHGSYAEAQRWFETYLQERPGGSFAREARGRLMEVDVRSGHVEAARVRAREYLARYPSGPHARVARELLSR